MISGPFPLVKFVRSWRCEQQGDEVKFSRRLVREARSASSRASAYSGESSRLGRKSLGGDRVGRWKLDTLWPTGSEIGAREGETGDLGGSSERVAS